VELAPISRDAIIWFLPWFIVLLVALGAAVILWRRLRPRRASVAGPDEADEALRQAQGASLGTGAP
jgi:cytochrome c-type biogenesis protein CcmH/NrfF